MGGRMAGLMDIPSCMGLPQRDTADVSGMAFLSAVSHKTKVSWSWGHQPDRKNHPFLGAESCHLHSDRDQGRWETPQACGDAAGKGMNDSPWIMSHTYYIRADQEYSNITQAQICPHRQGNRGVREETCLETRPGICITKDTIFIIPTIIIIIDIVIIWNR
jgi:hypothetical protein